MQISGTKRFFIQPERKNVWQISEKGGENSNWEDVDIPGFANVIDSKTSLLRRVLWAVAILICFFVCVNQIVERILFYRNSPVAVKVQIEDDTLPPMPRITICNELRSLHGKAMFNTPAVFVINSTTIMLNVIGPRYKIISTSREFINLWMTSECTYLAKLNMTLNEIWNSRKLTKKNLLLFGKIQGTNSYESISYTSEEFNDLSGPCFTLTIDNVDEYQEMKLKVINNFPLHFGSTYSIIFHQDQLPLTPEIQKKSEIFTPRTFPSKIRMSQFRTLNFSSDPCVTSEEHVECRQECLRRQLLATSIRCKFPVTIDDHVVRPNCAAFNDCTTGLRELRNALYHHNPNLCKCPRKCENNVYVATTTTTGNTLQCGDLSQLHCYAIMKISLPTSYTKITHVVAYNLVALFCDIGGSLGLCMGLCLISVLELIQNILFSLKQCCLKN